MIIKSCLSLSSGLCHNHVRQFTPSKLFHTSHDEHLNILERKHFFSETTQHIWKVYCHYRLMPQSIKTGGVCLSKYPNDFCYKSANHKRSRICHNTLLRPGKHIEAYTWWRHQMETFSALLAICAGNSPVPGESPSQRPVTRSFDVYFDLRLNKRLSK